MFDSCITLCTEDIEIDRAFRLAMGDIVSNIAQYKAGLLQDPKTVLLAGFNYNNPWTRDAAINTWNGTSLLCPEVMEHTLLAQVEENNTALRLIDLPGQSGSVIQGCYQGWDAIIWTIGAWWHYLYTGNRSFLELAFEVTKNALAFYEKTEFDKQIGLFRGAAVYGDGVAAYPDTYTTGGDEYSDIGKWVLKNPHLSCNMGYGLPMHVLSTNCIFYQVYCIVTSMAEELGTNADPLWQNKATLLRKNINSIFWMPEKGLYRYIVDPFGGCDYQEGLGHSFALLFQIPHHKQVQAIFENIHITPCGLACLWPTFPRYQDKNGTTFGRHSGTIWPFINAFWAHAAAIYSHQQFAISELRKIAHMAVQSSQFREIYHPLTGEPYGGEQEGAHACGLSCWQSLYHQTWSATGYFRMITMALLGMRFDSTGISFRPMIPEGIKQILLYNLQYRNMNIDICVEGDVSNISSFKINNKTSSKMFLSAQHSGKQKISIKLSA